MAVTNDDQTDSFMATVRNHRLEDLQQGFH